MATNVAPVTSKSTHHTSHKPRNVNIGQTEFSLLPGYGSIAWEPPHDLRVWDLPLIKGQLKRGYIVQDKNDPFVKNNPGKIPLGLSFLYNPTEVDVYYEINTSVYPNGAAPGSDVPLIGIPGAAQVSWDLIVDRTYEVNDSSAGVAYEQGIMGDIAHFEQMMGYTPDVPFVQPVSMFVVFGSLVQQYYGYISTWQATITNWTQDMRPYRGGIVGITMQILPLAKKAAKSDFETSKSNLKAAGLSTGKNKSRTGKQGGNPKDTGNGKSQKKKSTKARPALPAATSYWLSPYSAADVKVGWVLYSDAYGAEFLGTVSKVAGGIISFDNGSYHSANPANTLYSRSATLHGSGAKQFSMTPHYANQNPGTGSVQYTSSDMTGFQGTVAEYSDSGGNSVTHQATYVYESGNTDSYSDNTILWTRSETA